MDVLPKHFLHLIIRLPHSSQQFHTFPDHRLDMLAFDFCTWAVAPEAMPPRGGVDELPSMHDQHATLKFSHFVDCTEGWR